jgi:hypothetical protein
LTRYCTTSFALLSTCAPSTSKPPASGGASGWRGQGSGETASVAVCAEAKWKGTQSMWVS